MRTLTLPSTSAVMRCALFDFKNETTVGLHEQFKAHILIKSNLTLSPQKISCYVHCFVVKASGVGNIRRNLKSHRLWLAIEAVDHKHLFVGRHTHERV